LVTANLCATHTTHTLYGGKMSKSQALDKILTNCAPRTVLDDGLTHFFILNFGYAQMEIWAMKLGDDCWEICSLTMKD
jgi:hypothetical protein